jgi:hypothetical protein
VQHKTGEVSTTRGVYRSNCKCRVPLTIRRDQVYPYCPVCHRDVTWLFVRALSAGEARPPSGSTSAEPR